MNVPLPQLRELHLFAGCGGGILGGMLLGHTCVCAVEIEPYRRKVLLQRQRDGILPLFPIWDDVRTFDGRPWRGRVDVVCGGFPCQDISFAGRGYGIEGRRSGLWREMYRVICEIRPSALFVENSPALVVRGLGRVLGDLAQVGYDARWGVFRASTLGFDHQRERIFIYAYLDQELPNGKRTNSRDAFATLAARLDKEGSKNWRRRFDELVAMDVMSRISSYTEGRRILHGIPDLVDRIGATGDAQVPAVAALAWRTLA